MRYYYKSKSSDFYNASLVDNPIVWLSVSLTVTVVAMVAYAKGFKGWLVKDAVLLGLSIFVGLLLVEVVNARQHLGKISRIPSYLVCWLAYVGAINTALLNSRSKASMMNHSYRVLPKIWMYKEGANLFVKMEKLAGTYEKDLDNLAELVSSAVGESWRVTSKVIEDNENWFSFVLSPVDWDLVFVPKKVNDLQMPLYKVRLMNNLILDFSKVPHLACFGKTGSGKSTVLWSIVLQTIGNSELFFEDFKNEFSVLDSFYPKDHFAVNTDQVIELLEKLVNILNRRKKLVKDKESIIGVTGLTGYDLGLKPIYFIADEWASVMASFPESTEGRKQKKHCSSLMRALLMQSRAYAINILYVSQSPSTDVLSNQSRSQFGTYILLGSANSDTQRMAFNEVATTGSIGKFSGYYLESVADMDSPQRFYVPDIFKYHLNRVDMFKRIYERKNKDEFFD